MSLKRCREVPGMGRTGSTVYRQSTPVLGNLGPVTDWRSYFWDPNSSKDLHWVPGPPIVYEDWWTWDWWIFEELPHP